MTDAYVLNPTETIIEIPGITREIVLVHATDLHLTEADDRDPATLDYDDKFRLIFDKQAPPNFSRNRHLEQVVQLSNQIHADAVVFTGDMMHYPSAANLDFFRKNVEQLQSPYFLALGNHDWHFPHLPWNEQTRSEHYEKFIDFTQGEAAIRTTVFAGLRLIMVDNSNYQVDAEQLSSIQGLLSQSMPSLIFMHIPIYLPALVEKTVEKWKAPILMAAQGWTEPMLERWKVREADPSTSEFYQLLMENELGSMHGIFSGHLHLEHEEALPNGGLQYVTQAGFAGGVRIIRIVPA
jgi:hypothetical protein